MSNTLHVHTVTHWLSRDAGGLFFSVRRLAQEMASTGVKVDVTGLWDPHFDEDASSWSPLSPRAFRPLIPVNLGFNPSLVRHVADSLTADSILHLQGLWKLTSLAALSASRRRQTPVMISPRGMLDAWALSQSRAQKRVAGWLYENRNLRQATCMHALCDAERVHMRNFGLKNPVAVVPNGVDLPDLDANTASNPVPQAWQDRKRCLFISRVHPKKGLIPLVEAVAQCKAELSDWIFLLAGPDNNHHRSEVEARIHEKGLESQIHFTGPLYGEAKDAWLRHVDAFVLPSFSEGLPIAVLEAFAYALPAVITPECNLPAEDTAGAAIVVAPTANTLAEGLTRLASMNETARYAMGRQGRSLVERRYTWHSVAHEMIAVYHWMSDAGPKPGCVDEV